MSVQCSLAEKAFSISVVCDDKNAIHFYMVYHISGLFWELEVLFVASIPESLTPLNEFFLVICRLRLGLLKQDLAYRFRVSHSTVSRICITWIKFLFMKFKEVPHWPTRDSVNKLMPRCFREDYPTTRCIIDATEIFIQHLSSPIAQQLTFSSYKNHNTLKAIMVSLLLEWFVSWANCLGAVCPTRSLQYNVRSCTYLLEQGDSVMADRGFMIADLLAARGVDLNIPHEAATTTDRRRASRDKEKCIRLHHDNNIQLGALRSWWIQCTQKRSYLPLQPCNSGCWSGCGNASACQLPVQCEFWLKFGHQWNHEYC